ncbi:hypothetical protein TRFO_04976 [Tritrichomonas foetus]|uniref:DUF3447 domain-containing protein n=1 Tax=Tritrichomonas foetus TaxID=1144522 RepID=A0A1J4KFG8_9EUKA|nr:hypothetical protein TRFO_04976 [Tritrichomonas foetus]|eukprot:OHT08342.1 hypothetical protein TRFO_04976 [Tritrichomonas foetus]
MTPFPIESLPNDLFSQVNLSIDVCTIIYELDSNNFEKSIINFTHLVGSAQIDQIKNLNLLFIIKNAIQIRQTQLKILSQFLVAMEKAQIETINFSEFNNTLLKDILYCQDFIIRPVEMRFLKESVETGLFDVKTILNEIEKYYKKFDKYDIIHFYHFSWFAPEIEKENPFLYQKFIESMNSVHQKMKWEPDFEPFFSSFEKLRENNWKQFYSEINGDESTSYQIMKNDNHEFLQKKEHSNLNKKIIPGIFDCMLHVAKGNPSLLEISAFYGSIQSFKYLLLNEVEIGMGKTQTSQAFGRFHLKEHWNSMNFAIAGGNAEIIHLLERKCSIFEGCVEIAIKFHRNHIFKWLLENEKVDKEKLDRIKLFQACVESNNAKSLLYLLSKDFTITKNEIEVSKIKLSGICGEIIQFYLS